MKKQTKSIVKKIYKATNTQGPYYERQAAAASKHFLHVNPIKKAKSKTEKTINRKARQFQRKVTGHTEALQSYKRSRSHGENFDRTPKQARTVAKESSIKHKKNIQKRNKADAIFLGSALGATTGIAYGTKKVYANRKENKSVKDKLRKAVGK